MIFEVFQKSISIKMDNKNDENNNGATIDLLHIMTSINCLDFHSSQ